MTKFCSACGEALQDFDRYCYRCGASQPKCWVSTSGFREAGREISHERHSAPAPTAYAPASYPSPGTPALPPQLQLGTGAVEQVVLVFLPVVTIMIPMIMLGLSFALAAGRPSLSVIFALAELVLGTLVWYLLMFRAEISRRPARVAVP